VVLAHGLTVGGRQGARKALFDFWHRTAEIGTNARLFIAHPQTEDHNLITFSKSGRCALRQSLPPIGSYRSFAPFWLCLDVRFAPNNDRMVAFETGRNVQKQGNTRAI
jgi:hypothetical protein